MNETITAKNKKRLLSLDILRGMTIAGMILVNNAGACGHSFAMLRHARWDGFTPADLVFPMFMFVMGISIFISLRKYDFKFNASFSKIIKRTISIILCGIALKWTLNSMESGNWLDFENMRIMGVLQRLGICYGIVAIMGVTIKHKHFPLIAALLLSLYFILQIVGNGFEKCADNIASIVDNAILGTNHMYLHGKQFVDPEGILSTIPAVAQVMIGFICGKILISEPDNTQKMLKLFIIGSVLLICGYLLSYGSPLNKRLWSPSFVLVTCGISSTVLALLIYIVDTKHISQWGTFFKVIGVNPLVLYILSEILGDGLRLLGVPELTFSTTLQPAFGDYLGSFMYAAIFLLINWIVGYILYRKKIYIKL